MSNTHVNPIDRIKLFPNNNTPNRPWLEPLSIFPLEKWASEYDGEGDRGDCKKGLRGNQQPLKESILTVFLALNLSVGLQGEADCVQIDGPVLGWNPIEDTTDDHAQHRRPVVVRQRLQIFVKGDGQICWGSTLRHTLIRVQRQHLFHGTVAVLV